MIELRWITRGVDFYAINEGYPARYVEVLQYRTWSDTSPRTHWMDVLHYGMEQPSHAAAGGCPKCGRINPPACLQEGCPTMGPL